MQLDIIDAALFNNIIDSDYVIGAIHKKLYKQCNAAKMRNTFCIPITFNNPLKPIYNL